MVATVVSTVAFHSQRASRDTAGVMALGADGGGRVGVNDHDIGQHCGTHCHTVDAPDRGDDGGGTIRGAAGGVTLQQSA